IVTGAARGIGRAISLRLARDGLNVVASDLSFRRTELDNLAKEIQSGGKTKAFAHCADVSKENEVQELVKSTVDQFGAVDVMVANAGIGPSAAFVSSLLEEWENVMAINARGVFLCYKAAAIQMIKQGRGGRLIGASSLSGKQGSPEMVSYCASKFAVRAITQVAAKELWEHGITANGYAPAAVNTDILTDVAEDRKLKGLKEFVTPNSQLIPPEDIAALVSYLVRDEAKYVTGQTVSINLGMFCD
ncbi:hypothetical protein M422DRAFT_38888, partial [Sphaerobolus stellatus SS14]